MKKEVKGKTENSEFAEKMMEKGWREISRAERPNQTIEISLAKKTKNRVSIYLDAEVVEFFRNAAAVSGDGYQTLINRTLREMVSGADKNLPAPLTEAELFDKKFLAKLKAELEAV